MGHFSHLCCMFLMGEISHDATPLSKKLDEQYFFVYFFLRNSRSTRGIPFTYLYKNSSFAILPKWSDSDQKSLVPGPHHVFYYSSFCLFLLVPIRLSRFISYFGTQCLFLLLVCFPLTLSADRAFSQSKRKKMLLHKCIANILLAFNFASGKQIDSGSIRKRLWMYEFKQKLFHYTREAKVSAAAAKYIKLSLFRALG